MKAQINQISDKNNIDLDFNYDWKNPAIVKNKKTGAVDPLEKRPNIARWEADLDKKET